MAIRLNLNASATMVPVRGWPMRAWGGGPLVFEGVIHPWVTSATATLYSEAGTCDAHLAIFAMPTTSSGADGELVKQVDVSGVGGSSQSLTLSIPVGEVVETVSYNQDLTVQTNDDGSRVTTKEIRQAAAYVLRFWVDNITGSERDTIDRDTGEEATADNLVRIPTGVVVESIAVS